MKALLDTHVWLWYLLGDDRLSQQQRSWIEDERVELWLSPVSVWEAILLIERGRVAVAAPPRKWIDQALQMLPVRDAGLSFTIAAKSREVDVANEDPADRFIAATAIVMKLTLLTSDRRLLDCGDLACIS